MVIFFLNLHNYIIVNGIGLAAQTARNTYQEWERAGIQFQTIKLNNYGMNIVNSQDKMLRSLTDSIWN